MPSGRFKQVFLLLISLIVGATLLNLLHIQTELVVSWCLILAVRRNGSQRRSG